MLGFLVGRYHERDDGDSHRDEQRLEDIPRAVLDHVGFPPDRQPLVELVEGRAHLLRGTTVFSHAITRIF